MKAIIKPVFMEITGLYENQLQYDFNNIKKMAEFMNVKILPKMQKIFLKIKN